MNTIARNVDNQPTADDQARPQPAPIPPASRDEPWKRRALAVLLGIHGFAHLVGTTDAATAISDGTAVDYLFGQWQVADSGTLAVAATVWALVALAFAVAAVRPAVAIRTDGAQRDPDPKPRPRGPSLDGPRAWALMRSRTRSATRSSGHTTGCPRY